MWTPVWWLSRVSLLCLTHDLLGGCGDLLQAASLSENRLALYDAGHRFEHIPLLLVLLRSLPFATKQLQLRALQVSKMTSA
jgi:hypothetical protein